MGLPHALVLPFPAQGHVISLMELSHCLVDSGFMVTFVNTEHTHSRVVAAATSETQPHLDTERLRMVAIPDGLPPDDSRTDGGRTMDAILRFMPGHLEELIRKMNEESGDGDKITCLVADETMAWAMDVAKKMGLRSATYWPAPAGTLAAILSIPKLIEDGVIDSEGHPKKESFQLAPGLPVNSSEHLVWNLCREGEMTQQIVYRYMVNNNRATELAEFVICNTFLEVEQPVLNYAPKLLPVGPLRTGLRLGRPVGHFWSEDPGCLAWLDGQPAGSVVYVAFGSFTVVGQRQFQELALGLELTGRPFLWVVRRGLVADDDPAAAAYPPGFTERVAGRGKVVGWAPQHRVLAHPAVACFFSHCGWNSTMEGVTNGLPFLCWPYFADQFLNRDYICDSWRTGLGVAADAEGIISKEEIRGKLEALLGNEGIKERAMELKEAARRNVEVGGTSYKNFQMFVEAMRG